MVANHYEETLSLAKKIERYIEEKKEFNLQELYDEFGANHAKETIRARVYESNKIVRTGKGSYILAGVSGSVTCSFNPDVSEIKYGYSRLGMLKKDENRKIYFYDRIFPKENISIVMPENNFFDGIEKESIYNNNFDGDSSEYYTKIIDTIAKYHEGSNTMILCGGYRECKYLAEIYKLKYGDAVIHYSNTEEKTYATLEKFKEQGGILFATKNYGTGISLEGKLLEKMFILKLPYPDYTIKKWQELKFKNNGLFRKNIEREMTITFMQFLGRVARTPTDTGSIIILDYNFLMKKLNIKKKIIEILNEYGIFDKKQEKKEEKSFENAMINLFLDTI